MRARPRSTCSGATPHPPLRRFVPLALLLATTASGQSALQSNDQQPPTLWYCTPAATWNEALPIGNGRLGAMVFGGVEREHLQLNEETLWSGGPYDPVVKDASAALPQIRQLLFAGDIARAHDLFGRRMMGKPYEQMKYQPLGDLLLDFGNVSAVSDYRRELDLDRAVAQVTYRSGGVTYMREVFASAADQVLVMRLTADRPGRWRAGSVAVLLGTTVAAATPFLISHLSRVVCTATDCL